MSPNFLKIQSSFLEIRAFRGPPAKSRDLEPSYENLHHRIFATDSITYNTYFPRRWRLGALHVCGA